MTAMICVSSLEHFNPLFVYKTENSSLLESYLSLGERKRSALFISRTSMFEFFMTMTT